MRIDKNTKRLVLSPLASCLYLVGLISSTALICFILLMSNYLSIGTIFCLAIIGGLASFLTASVMVDVHRVYSSYYDKNCVEVKK